MRTGQPPSTSGEQGFTLLELLIAVSLLALLFAMMAGSLRFGVTVWDRGDSLAARSSELTIAQRFIRRQVGEALALRDPNAERQRVTAFVGGARSMRFIASRMAQSAIGGPFVVGLDLRGTGTGGALTLTWREVKPDLSDFRLVENQQARELLSEVEAIEIAYFGANEAGDAVDWHTSWEDRTDLPSLVRIRVKFVPGSRNIWPELIVVTGARAIGPGRDRDRADVRTTGARRSDGHCAPAGRLARLA